MSGSAMQLPRWLVFVLSFGLAISLAGAGLLAYFFWDLHSRFSRAEESLNAQFVEAEKTLDERIARAQTDLTAIMESALARAPDVDAVQDRLDTLEETLFGLQGAPPFALDLLGRLERDLTTCANNGFNTLQANLERVENYVAALSAGLLAIRPSTFAPRCY